MQAEGVQVQGAHLMLPDSSQGCCVTIARLPCTATLPASSWGSPKMPRSSVLLPLPATPLTTASDPRGTCADPRGTQWNM